MAILKLILTSVAITILFSIGASMESFAKSKKITKFWRQFIVCLISCIASVLMTYSGNYYIMGKALSSIDAVIAISTLLFGPLPGIICTGFNICFRLFLTTYVSSIYYISKVTMLSITIDLFICLFAYYFIFKKQKPIFINFVCTNIVIVIVHLCNIGIFGTFTGTVALQNIVYALLPAFVINVGLGIVVYVAIDYVQMFSKDYHLGDYIQQKKWLTHKNSIYLSFQFWLTLIFVFMFAVNISFVMYFCEKSNFENAEFVYSDELITLNELIKDDYRADPSISFVDYASEYVQDWCTGGYVDYVLLDQNQKVICDPNGDFVNDGDLLEYPEMQLCIKNLEKERFYFMYRHIDNLILLAYVPEATEMASSNVIICIISLFEIVIFAILLASIFFILKKFVIEKLNEVNESLDQITAGNLDARINVYTAQEFSSLSNSINSTVDTLNRYIEEEANRYNADFEIARQIQVSALPNVFPPFPDAPELDFYSLYRSAKVVGGDFYDYFFVAKDTVVFLIADVSGKSIPAAMFMMRAKSALRTAAIQSSNPAKIMEFVNDSLCEYNDAGMFVTVWLGVANAKTGDLEYVSAGHNPPYVINPFNKTVKKLEAKPGLVLGAMSGMKYKLHKYQFQPGEKLFLYTDGVVEAHDTNNNLYGEDRLEKLLLKNRRQSIKNLTYSVWESVKDFSDGQEQFDDLSIVTFIYNGIIRKKEDKYCETQLTVKSDLASVNRVIDQCEYTIENSTAPESFVQLFDVCIDEVFSNVMKYGYKDRVDNVSINIIVDERKDPKCFKIIFKDMGPKFNPLNQPAPDITLSAEEREIGGLGIHMVKTLTDEIQYEYTNSINQFTIIKYF